MSLTYPVSAPALQFELTCPNCGADMVLINGGRFSSREVTALVECSECPSLWSIRVDMVQVGRTVRLPGESPLRRPVAECGTDGGYHRHKRLREPFCDPCRDAHAASARKADAVGATA